jgi:thioredoxin 1
MAELVHVSDANFTEVVEKGSKPALLDFGATWCGPCKALEPTIVALAGEFGDKVTIAKVDVDESQQVALRFGIMAVPTVIFFKGGKEVHRFSGLQSKDKITAMIQTHLIG